MEHGPLGLAGEPVQQLVEQEHKAVLEHVLIPLHQMVELTVQEMPVNLRLVTLELAQVLLKCNIVPCPAHKASLLY